MDTAATLEAYLRAHIPLTEAMEVCVARLDESGVTLCAPLGPNINHRQSAFGGSIASLATLAAWGLLHTRLGGESHRIVVASSRIEYLLPVCDAFCARCDAPDEAAWARFLKTLARHGKARMLLNVSVACGGSLCATLEGEFVALAQR
jgi:thioesterase domain-containing protein